MKNKGKIITNIIFFIVSILPLIIGTFGIKFIMFNGFFSKKAEIDKVFSVFGNIFLIGLIFIFIIGIVFAIVAIVTLAGCMKKKEECEEVDIKEMNTGNITYKIMMILEVIIYILIFIGIKI